MGTVITKLRTGLLISFCLVVFYSKNAIIFLSIFRTARGIETCLRELLDKDILGAQIFSGAVRDARFVPLPWNKAVAQEGNKLRIGW